MGSGSSMKDYRFEPTLLFFLSYRVLKAIYDIFVLIQILEVVDHVLH